MRIRTPLLVGTAAFAVVLSGCSTKAADDGGGSNAGGLKTDVGVTDEEISLGVLTDTSGVFKASGIAYTAGNQLWVKDVNDRGGICDRQITLDIQDHGYKADNAVSLYATMKTKDVAIIQMIGSPIVAALKAQITNDHMISIPASWASDNLDSEAVLMVGQTYDIEMINGMAFLQQQGMIADGDKVGHIYIDSEYGLNALKGSKAYAKEHDIEILEAGVSSTDVDMTATVTKFKAEGVKAILVTTAYAATGSVVLQNVSQGLNVPVLGSSPTFSTTLLADPSVVSALENFYAVYSNDAFDTGSNNELIDQLEKEYAASYTDPPDDSITGGYVSGMVLEAILEQACEDGDMTRAGVVAARKKLDSVDTKGITGTLDLSDPGAPTTREGMIMKVDPNTAVGLTMVQDFSASEEAKAYKTPFEK